MKLRSAVLKQITGLKKKIVFRQLMLTIVDQVTMDHELDEGDLDDHDPKVEIPPDHYSWATKGLAMASIPSTGQIRT